MSCRLEADSPAEVVVPTLSAVASQLLDLSPEEAVCLAEWLLDAGYFDEEDSEEETTKD